MQKAFLQYVVTIWTFKLFPQNSFTTLYLNADAVDDNGDEANIYWWEQLSTLYIFIAHCTFSLQI